MFARNGPSSLSIKVHPAGGEHPYVGILLVKDTGLATGFIRTGLTFAVGGDVIDLNFHHLDYDKRAQAAVEWVVDTYKVHAGLD